MLFYLIEKMRWYAAVPFLQKKSLKQINGITSCSLYINNLDDGTNSMGSEQ